MTGEKFTQPGGREPAPGQLRVLQAFLNTRWDLARDDHGETLTTGAELRDWLAGHGLLAPGSELESADLERALEVREAIRALAFANNGVAVDPASFERLERASRGATAGIRIGADGPRFIPGAGGGVGPAIGALLGVVAAAMIDGSWARLKACPGRGCGWAFYDASRNGSARWCSMKVCGDREKARAYYHRRSRVPAARHR